MTHYRGQRAERVAVLSAKACATQPDFEDTEQSDDRDTQWPEPIDLYTLGTYCQAPGLPGHPRKEES